MADSFTIEIAGFPVRVDGDDADSLAARVFEQECLAYPEAIRLFAENRLEVKNGNVCIKT